MLVVPQWQRADWETFLRFTTPVSIAAGDVVIRKDEPTRALYLLWRGVMEVTAILGTHSLGPIAKIRPGSAFGELSFLDGKPRSAMVWAVTNTELARLEYDDYTRFAAMHPALSSQLIFGMARLIAERMRRMLASSKR